MCLLVCVFLLQHWPSTVFRVPICPLTSCSTTSPTLAQIPLLGPKIGGSVGCVYFLGITLLAVLEAMGAVEMLLYMAPPLNFPGTPPQKKKSTSALAVSILCACKYSTRVTWRSTFNKWSRGAYQSQQLFSSGAFQWARNGQWVYDILLWAMPKPKLHSSLGVQGAPFRWLSSRPRETIMPSTCQNH